MRCALWGGISLGVGTVAFALFSPSSVSCSTNVVVLTHSAVTARGCAAYSVVAHVGVGLIVLGSVLLLGSFALALRNRRHAGPSGVAAAADAVPAERTAPATTTPSPGVPTAASPGPQTAPSPSPQTAPAGTPIPATAPTARTAPAGTPIPVTAPTAPTAPAGTPTPVAPGTPTPERMAAEEPVHTGPIPPGAEVPAWQGDGPGPLGSSVQLPPGWYGNPNTPGKPVQWWDGTKLVDRPG